MLKAQIHLIFIIHPNGQSLIAGPLDGIKFSHRVDEFKPLLVG